MLPVSAFDAEMIASIETNNGKAVWVRVTPPELMRKNPIKLGLYFSLLARVLFGITPGHNAVSLG